MNRLTEFFNPVMRKWYRFTRGVNNLIFWLPKIWSHKDWEYEYMYRIIRLQAEYMLKDIDQVTYVDTDHIEKDLNTLIRLCHRIENDVYFEEVGLDEALELKVDKGEYQFIKNVDEKEYKKLLKLEDISRQNDIDMVAELLKERSETWWI